MHLALALSASQVLAASEMEGESLPRSLGDVRPAGVTQAAVERAIPRRTHAEAAALRATPAVDEEECTVCLSQLQPTDTVRLLPCSHCFHVDCIDSWLLSGRPRGLMMTPPVACPVCSRVVDDAAYAEMKCRGMRGDLALHATASWAPCRATTPWPRSRA